MVISVFSFLQWPLSYADHLFPDELLFNQKILDIARDNVVGTSYSAREKISKEVLNKADMPL